jgi:cytoskeleton protein RodZ
MNEVHSMTNQDPQGGSTTVDTAVASAPSVSAGILLRQAREASGLHIAALAVIMKVPVKKLEALESDRIDLLPDAVFARALASSVCRTLKVDAQPILERLPHNKKVNLTVEARAANAPFNASGYSSANNSPMSVGKTAMLVVALLLLGAALIVWVPTSPESNSAPDLATMVPTELQPEGLAQSVEEIVVPWGTTPTETTPVGPIATPPVSSPVAPPAVAHPAVAPVEAAATQPVVLFKTRGDSWIEVVDAKGELKMRRNVTMNESVEVAGALPLQVVVGRADLTEVWVRGQPLDISKMAQGNVARFEVR